MSEVKRYDPMGYDRLSGYMQQHPEGDYVRHADYAALEAECERLRVALEHCSEVMKDPWRHGEGCISRAINLADAALLASTGQEVKS